MERPLLDPQLLQSFVAIVETGSFTRAAERIHLTQSTLSQQMRRLEQQLGCTLLDRSGRQVVTTAQGETLLGLARRILGLLARAGERVSEASHPLRLGVPEDFAAGAMTPVLAAFARAHPQVRLEVQSDLSHALWQAFEGGELDLALIKQGRGQGEPIARWREPLAWVDSREWPAAGRDPPASGGVSKRGALPAPDDRRPGCRGDPLAHRLRERQSRQPARGGERGDRGQPAASAPVATGSGGAGPLACSALGGAGSAPGAGHERAPRPAGGGADRAL